MIESFDVGTMHLADMRVFPKHQQRAIAQAAMGTLRRMFMDNGNPNQEFDHCTALPKVHYAHFLVSERDELIGTFTITQMEFDVKGVFQAHPAPGFPDFPDESWQSRTVAILDYLLDHPLDFQDGTLLQIRRWVFGDKELGDGFRWKALDLEMLQLLTRHTITLDGPFLDTMEL